MNTLRSHIITRSLATEKSIEGSVERHGRMLNGGSLQKLGDRRELWKDQRVRLAYLEWLSHSIPVEDGKAVGVVWVGGRSVMCVAGAMASVWRHLRAKRHDLHP